MMKKVLVLMFCLTLLIAGCNAPVAVSPDARETEISGAVQQTLAAAAATNVPLPASATEQSATATITPTVVGDGLGEDNGATPTEDVTATATSTATATLDPAAPPLLVTIEPGGSDSGGEVVVQLGYPSSGIPPLRVTLRDRTSGEYRYIDTTQNTMSVVFNNVAPGNYVAYAYVRDGSGFAGGFTQMVPCGLSVDCTDHSLIEFPVKANTRVTGVNVQDWYAPEGSFPPNP